VNLFTSRQCKVALIERGADHQDLWVTLGVSRPENRLELDRGDLDPNAIPCLSAVRMAGLAVGIAGDQPAGTEALLQAAGVHADFIASSAEWAVAKPDSRFFERVVEESGVAANAILYVGDRLDNDVLPARRAGMRTASLPPSRSVGSRSGPASPGGTCRHAPRVPQRPRRSHAFPLTTASRPGYAGRGDAARGTAKAPQSQSLTKSAGILNRRRTDFFVMNSKVLLLVGRFGVGKSSVALECHDESGRPVCGTV
jgi:hypothetical protein